MENTLENAKACMLKTNRSNQDITNIEMMVAYAASVRPEVVVPSEEEIGEKIQAQWNEPDRKHPVSFRQGVDWILGRIKQLNNLN